MLKRVLNYASAEYLPTKVYVEKVFYQKTGRKLNLSNPKTFSEKIQWLKLYYRNPLLTLMADKIEAKHVVAEKVGDKHIVPTHSTFSNAEDIKHKDLPRAFALKATHGSGWNIIKKDKNEITEDEIRSYFSFWLKKSYYRYSKEWAYKNIKPRVVCEELLFTETGDLPMDYKIFCFGGQALHVQVDHDRFSHHTRSIYDREWNKLNFSIGYKMNKEIIPPPKNFSTMLNIAEVLSKQVPFLRVDLYNINGAIYCGELTCYPGNGMETFTDSKWDEHWGSLIDLKAK